jgi:hypothetical protein
MNVKNLQTYMVVSKANEIIANDLILNLQLHIFWHFRDEGDGLSLCERLS